MVPQQDRREMEIEMEREGRLPPGQSLTQKFPVLHYGKIPPFNPDSWRFFIRGEVEEELSWTWDEFSQLPSTEIKMDIHCVTRWSKFDTTWKGISVRTLVDEGIIELKPSAKSVSYKHLTLPTTIPSCRYRWSPYH